MTSKITFATPPLSPSDTQNQIPLSPPDVEISPIPPLKYWQPPYQENPFSLPPCSSILQTEGTSEQTSAIQGVFNAALKYPGQTRTNPIDLTEEKDAGAPCGIAPNALENEEELVPDHLLFPPLFGGDLDPDGVAYFHLNTEKLEELASLAENLQRQGKWPKCLETANRALEINWISIRALLCKADALQHLGDYQESLETIKLVLLLEPGNHTALLYKSKALAQKGKWVKSLKTSEKLIDRDNSNFRAWICKICALRHLSTQSYEDPSHQAMPNAASGVAQRIHRVKELLIAEAALLKIARESRAQSQWNECLESATGVLEIMTNHPLALCYQAEAMLNLGDFRGALHAVNQSLSSKPDVFSSIYLKAQILLKQNNHEEFLETADRALAINHNAIQSAELYYLKATLLTQLGRYDEALKNAKNAREILPEHIPILEAMVDIFIKLENYSDSTQFINKIFYQDPNSLFAYERQIYILCMSEQFSKAIPFCQRALEVTEQKIKEVEALIAGQPGCHLDKHRELLKIQTYWIDTLSQLNDRIKG